MAEKKKQCVKKCPQKRDDLVDNHCLMLKWERPTIPKRGPTEWRSLPAWYIETDIAAAAGPYYDGWGYCDECDVWIMTREAEEEVLGVREIEMDAIVAGRKEESAKRKMKNAHAALAEHDSRFTTDNAETATAEYTKARLRMAKLFAEAHNARQAILDRATSSMSSSTTTTPMACPCCLNPIRLAPVGGWPDA